MSMFWTLYRQHTLVAYTNLMIRKETHRDQLLWHCENTHSTGQPQQEGAKTMFSSKFYSEDAGKGTDGHFINRFLLPFEQGHMVMTKTETSSAVMIRNCVSHMETRIKAILVTRTREIQPRMWRNSPTPVDMPSFSVIKAHNLAVLMRSSKCLQRSNILC